MTQANARSTSTLFGLFFSPFESKQPAAFSQHVELESKKIIWTGINAVLGDIYVVLIYTFRHERLHTNECIYYFWIEMSRTYFNNRLNRFGILNPAAPASGPQS